MKKIRNWSLLMKIYIHCSEGIIFQNNWYVYCIPILWICRQPKHHQLRIGSEIFILLEIILNALMFDSIIFNLNPYFGYSATFVYFSLHPLSICYAARCVYTFYCPLRKKRCTLHLVGTDVHIWQHIHQKYLTLCLVLC